MVRFDESVGGIASVAAVFLLLTTATVALRFVARRQQQQPIGIDGWFTIPAWIFFIGIVIDALHGVTAGFIAHPEPATKEGLLAIFPSVGKSYWVLDGFSILSLGCTRLSILFFYRRIFVPTGKGRSAFSIATIVAIVINCLWIPAFVLFIAFTCGTDFSGLISPTNSVDCHDLQFLESATISSFILDFLILIMPLPVIFKLHANTGRKLAIAGVFLLGTAGVAASCARMVVNIELVEGGPSIKHEDAFLANSQLVYYIILEAGLCLVATNLPSLWYFVSKGAMPEKLVRSVRSMISLGSLGSKDRKTDYASNKNTDAASSHSCIELTQDYSVEFENMQKQQNATKNTAEYQV